LLIAVVKKCTAIKHGGPWPIFENIGGVEEERQK
jgi:hypothetical protein